MSIVQLNPYRPRPSHFATESQSYRFSVKIVAGPPLLGGPKFFFFTEAEPALGSPGCNIDGGAYQELRWAFRAQIFISVKQRMFNSYLLFIHGEI
jgi:hypothetical protein